MNHGWYGMWAHEYVTDPDGAALRIVEAVGVASKIDPEGECRAIIARGIKILTEADRLDRIGSSKRPPAPAPSAPPPSGIMTKGG